MKCPNCHHASDAPFACAACGQRYDHAKLQTLHHLEYLLVWLGKHAASLRAQDYERLQNKSWTQLNTLRSELGLTPLPPPRSPQDIAPELSLTTATLKQIQRWVQAQSLDPVVAAAFGQHLAGRVNALNSELLGRTVALEPPSAQALLDFGRASLPQWAADVPLPAADAAALHAYLEAQWTERLHLPARELALVEASLDQVWSWVEAKVIGDAFATGPLYRYLTALVYGLKAQLAGVSVEVEPPTEIQVLDYILKSLSLWAQNVPFQAHELDALCAYLSEQRDAHLQAIAYQTNLLKITIRRVNSWAAAGVLFTKKPLQEHLQTQRQALRTQLADRSVEVGLPSDLELIDFALASLPTWAAQAPLDATESAALQTWLRQRRVMLLESSRVAAQPEPVPETPAQPKPVPTTPARPKITVNWGELWDRTWKLVVSGALLRGLLYLGAFMIVVAAAVLVVGYWDEFPSGLRLVFVAAVPLTFYLTGAALRVWFQAPQAGGVFVGIGALLVAVDFAAVYQFGRLAGRVDLGLYWLGASLVCTLIYALSAWRLPTEFFGYVTLIGLNSLTLALTYTLRLPLEWEITSLTALGLALLPSAKRLQASAERWAEIAQATRRLPCILIPLTQILVLFVPGQAAWGQAATFALAALAFGLLALEPNSKTKDALVWAYTSVWSLIPSAAFVLIAVGMPPECYAMAMVVYAFAYLLASQQIRLSQYDAWHIFSTASQRTGLGLLAGTVLAGIVTLAQEHLWAGVIALTLNVLVLAWCAWAYRRPLFVALAGGLFIAPFTSVCNHGLGSSGQLIAWLSVAWAGLALIYLGLALSLRKAPRYAARLYFWVHLLPLGTISGLLINYTSTQETWSGRPMLAALAGLISIYWISAVIHHSQEHAGLSDFVARLPAPLASTLFMWPLGLLLPLWLAVAWLDGGFAQSWLGAALAVLALAYVGLGQWLADYKTSYRLPFHSYAYALAATGMLLSSTNAWALLAALLLTVSVLVSIAWVYQRVLEATLAALLFVWPFQLALDLSPLSPHTYTLAFALLAALAYVPLAMTVKREFARPLYLIGYSMSACALGVSLIERLEPFARDVSWVGVVTPLVIAASQLMSLYRLKRTIFAWSATLTCAISFGQSLALLRVPAVYDAAAWVGLAWAYLLTGFALSSRRDWLAALRWPLGVGSVILCTLGLLLTSDGTLAALAGQTVDVLPLILAQVLVVGLLVAMARLYCSHWPLYLQPWLALIPLSLFFVHYDAQIFGQNLTVEQFGIVWALLALVHLAIAAALDHLPIRYAHGLYLGGYGLGLIAILWTLPDEDALFWTLALGLAAALAFAIWVHLERHRTWNEFVHLLNAQQTVIHDAFLWLLAWAFPTWCVLLLRQLGINDHYQWLGLAAPPLLFLALALGLRRVKRAYVWPWLTAAQVYTALALLISTPLSVDLVRNALAGRQHLASDTPDAAALVALQSLAVIFYAASARIFRERAFAHLAAWLSAAPFTLAWVIFQQTLSPAHFAGVWLGWAVVLLGVGLALDRFPIRYAHGPCLAGYVLTILALLWSLQTLLSSLYTLGGVILLALVSHVLVHYGWHHSFDDLLNFCSRAQQLSVARRAARTTFLFVAVYTFPVWLTLLLTYHRAPVAWRGLGLALVAPLYIAFGLAVRRTRSEYTWPLYSAGYALTAIGALLTFEDQRLAIYVLALDAVVYAVSAYIFQQSFWLYLSNTLTPVIALLTLYYNRGALPAREVTLILMTLTFLYFGAGVWFDRRRTDQTTMDVAPFALPFYAPAYLLSTVALAVSSNSRSLALPAFSAGAVFYVLSAWALREPIFLYQATWLAAVPYYLGLTLTSLPGAWYGLAWLPLILAYLAIGRLLLQKGPLGIKNLPGLLNALPHPAMPFYLTAYSLSVGMLALSGRQPLPFTLALAAGAALYLASARVFRHWAWLYPGLAAMHLALAAGFTIYPAGRAGHYVTLPFLALTWLVALLGIALSRRAPSGQLHVGRPTRDFAYYLLDHVWARPFFQFVALDLILWQALALPGFDTTIILGCGYGLLLALFASSWRDTAVAYGALAYLGLAGGAALRWAGLPLADALAWVAGAGFGLYLLTCLLEWASDFAPQAKAWFMVWPRPLSKTAFTLNGLALVITVPLVNTYGLAAIASLGFAGALCLTHSYRERNIHSSYAGMALLKVAWILILVDQQIRQPQLYAIPAGSYLAVIGALERRQGRRSFALCVECFGLAVLLLTTFAQSLQGVAGLPYVALLLVEGLAVVWWGAVRRVKIPFFIGLGACVLDVLGQIVIVATGGYHSSSGSDKSSLPVWLVILGVGLMIMLLAVFVERQRTRIIAQAHFWREALESWE